MSYGRTLKSSSRALRRHQWQSTVSSTVLDLNKQSPSPFLLPALSKSSIPTSHPRLRPCNRHFSTTDGLHKSKNKGDKHNASNIERAEAKVAASTNDPFDFSHYESEIAQAHEDMKAHLAKIRVNALDAEAVESLRVKLDSSKNDHGGKKNAGRGSSGQGDTVTIADVASVMKRGRNLVIMVGEKDHLKPILRALQTLPSAPNPQSTPGADPLHLTLPIPPTTGEDRQNAVKRAEAMGPKVLHQLREARGAQLKRLRAMELTGKVGPDNMRRAKTRMEGVNEKAGAEAKKMVEEVKKRLERG